MRQIDSSALELVNRALHLGSGGAQTQQLDDGIVSLVLDVGGIANRGQELVAGSANLFTAVIANTHGAGVTTVSRSEDPYRPTNPTFGFPDPVPEGVDLFLKGACVFVKAGGGALANFTNAILDLAGASVEQAWGIQNGAAAYTNITTFPLAFWSQQSAGVGLGLDGRAFVPLDLRLRRGGVTGSTFPTVGLISSATNAVVVELLLLLEARRVGL